MDEFEKERLEMIEFLGNKENVVEWIQGSKTVTCTLARNRISTHLLKMAEKYPDEVQVDVVNKDKTYVFHVPLSWVSIRKPRRVEMTEERKQRSIDALKAYREKKLMEEDAENLSPVDSVLEEEV